MRQTFKTTFKLTVAACAVAASGHAAAQLTFYQQGNFQGPSFIASGSVNDLSRAGFRDSASSVVVSNGRWEICDNVRFAGRCAILQPGNYPSLAGTGLNGRIASVRTAGRDVPPPAPVVSAPPAVPPGAQIVFYEGADFQGRSFTAQNQVDDFSQFGFNDRASSAVVIGDRWEACENARFGGRCVVMRPGRYPSLVAMGMDSRVSSVRAVNYDATISDNRYAPPAPMVYDNRRRNDELLYQVNVSSVRAVINTPEQRCWMEPAPVQPQAQRANPNIGGAVVGALLGGILGHQVGGGTGKDIATVGGVVAGAAVGANVGRNRNLPQPAAAPEVQRCSTENVQNSAAQPDYWDVSYNFRGQEHRVQMTTQPGPTITVNGQGEPRV